MQQESSSGGTARVRILRQETGTEQFIVVKIAVKAEGAKGLRYPVLQRGQLIRRSH